MRGRLVGGAAADMPLWLTQRSESQRGFVGGQISSRPRVRGLGCGCRDQACLRPGVACCWADSSVAAVIELAWVGGEGVDRGAEGVVTKSSVWAREMPQSWWWREVAEFTRFQEAHGLALPGSRS